MAKQKVIVVKEKAIVNIEVSGAYYNRVVDVMTRLIEKQPDPKLTMVNISTEGKELSISEAVIQTYMMLIKSVEEAVNKDSEKFTEEVEIDIPEEATEDPSEN